MSNPVKRNTSGTETYSLNKGNLWFGVGGREYGPTFESDGVTELTGFYLGITPPKDGYVIYVGKASGGQANYVAASDSDLINIVNSITSNTFADVEEALDWVAGQDDFAVINKSEPEIVIDGLILNLDPSSLLSYPTTGSDGYDTSGNGNDVTLENGADWDNGGWFDFDGIDDIIRGPNINPSEITVEIYKKWTTISDDWLISNQISTVTDSKYGYFMRIDSPSNNFTSYFGVGSTARSIVYNPVVTNRWTHILATYNSTSGQQLYWNGENTGESTGNGAIDYTGVEGLAIGAANNLTRATPGPIGPVRIYNKALSESEVKQNYYGGPIVTDGLIFAVDGSNLVQK